MPRVLGHPPTTTIPARVLLPWNPEAGLPLPQIPPAAPVPLSTCTTQASPKNGILKTAPLSSRHREGRGAGLGAGPVALAVKSPLLEPAGPGLVRKAAWRAGCGRAGLALGSRRPGPESGPPGWSAGAIYRRPAESGRAPLPTSRAGQGTAQQPGNGPEPRRRESHRGRRAKTPPRATSDPRCERSGRVRAGRPGPAVAPGRPGRERRRWRRNVLEARRAGDNYLLSGTARESPGRGSSRARPPRVPRAPSRAASRSAHSADAPLVEQRRSRRRISAPLGAAAAAARSRPPSAPTPRSAATGGAAPGAGLCLFGQGEGRGAGGGAGRGRAGRGG